MCNNDEPAKTWPESLREHANDEKRTTKCNIIYRAFVGLAYQGTDIVFRFIIGYSSLRDFGPQVIIIIGLVFLYEDF
jgi:hypothetical protein